MKKVTSGLIGVLVGLLFCFNANAQHKCDRQHWMDQVLKEHPHVQQQRNQVEAQTQAYTVLHKNDQLAVGGFGNGTIYTIPVVFHVIWNTQAENVSNALIQQQMNTLNNDFRRLNADAVNTPAVFAAVAADARINFCLAQVDPNGNPTSGITRTQTTRTIWNDNDSMKFAANGGANAWNTSQYLNIWVCNLDTNQTWAFAYAPGGAPSSNVDGIRVNYNFVGNSGHWYNGNGRVLTHEVGHYLNLEHLWGPTGTSCQSDFCGDTPIQPGPNSFCPTFPNFQVPNCTPPPTNGDMFMNYMDFSSGTCMNMFSCDQALRMRAQLATGGLRAGLTTGNVCTQPCAWGIYALGTNTITYNSAVASWSAPNFGTPASYTVRYRPVGSTTWTFSPAITTLSYTMTGLSASTNYEWQVQCTCTSGNSTPWGGLVTFTTLAPPPCTPDPTEPNDFQNLAFNMNPGITVWPFICPATDVDFFAITNQAQMPDFNINVAALPADYGMELRDATGTILASSLNPGLAPEFINYQNGPIGTYYVRVFAQTPAYSITLPYSFNYTLANSCGTDAQEPNDQTTTAWFLSNPSVNGLICAQNDVDYFAFNGDPNNSDNVINLGVVGLDYDLELLDQNGNVLASSITAGTGVEQIQYTINNSNPHFIRVFSNVGAYHNSTNYSLQLQQSPPVPKTSSIAEQILEASDWSIYPNPAQEQLNLIIESSGSYEAQWQILDMSGKQLLGGQVSGNSGEQIISVELPDMSPGSYVIQLNQGGHVTAKKLLIE